MKILVIGPSWVGDMMMSQSLYRTLQARYPQAIIDVMAPAWCRPLLSRMPEVNEAIPMPLGHGALEIGERRKLGHSLREKRYDRAYVLPNSFKSALIPNFAGIAQRTGWRGEMRYGLLNDLRVLDKLRYPLMVQRFVALAYPKGHLLAQSIPYPSLRVEPLNCQRARRKFALHLDKPVLALCPGAEFGQAKRWPEKHYATVAAQGVSEGCQVWLFGSNKDQAVAEEVIRQVPTALRSNCFNLAGRTQLAEAVDLLALADSVVSNDSGLMHIAAALNRPLVVVYGSSSAEFTPPLSEQAEVVSIPVDCGPCFQRECPLHHLKCLHDLPPQRVIEALQRLEPGNRIQN